MSLDDCFAGELTLNAHLLAILTHNKNNSSLIHSGLADAHVLHYCTVYNYFLTFADVIDENHELIFLQIHDRRCLFSS